VAAIAGSSGPAWRSGPGRCHGVDVSSGHGAPPLTNERASPRGFRLLLLLQKLPRARAAWASSTDFAEHAKAVRLQHGRGGKVFRQALIGARTSGVTFDEIGQFIEMFLVHIVEICARGLIARGTSGSRVVVAGGGRGLRLDGLRPAASSLPTSGYVQQSSAGARQGQS